VTEPAALVFEERQLSLPELHALAAGLAAILTKKGVTAGQRVAVMSSNRPEFVAALLAIWRLGATATLIGPAWKRDEVDHALALTDPAHAVGDHPVLAGLMPMLNLDEPTTP
jgi:long-chain acyl-CoA synthetase